MGVLSFQILPDQISHPLLVVISWMEFGMIGEVYLHGSFKPVVKWKTSDLGRQEHQQEDEEET